MLKWGFSVSDSSVVLNISDPNLKGEQRYLKAELTAIEAKKLRKAFARAGGLSSQITTQPKHLPLNPHRSKEPDLMSGLGNPEWNPDLVKQGWSGIFRQQERSSVFLCSYVMDTKNPEKVVLYFYGITFDD